MKSTNLCIFDETEALCDQRRRRSWRTPEDHPKRCYCLITHPSVVSSYVVECVGLFFFSSSGKVQSTSWCITYCFGRSVQCVRCDILKNIIYRKSARGASKNNHLPFNGAG